MANKSKFPLNRILFFIPFVSWIPMVIWATSPKWAPIIFGPNTLTIESPGALPIAISVVFIGTIVVTSILPFAKPMMSLFGGSRETKRILNEGRPGTAEIVAIGPSSMGGTVTVNNNPYLGITVTVNDGFQAPYTTSVDTIVPQYELPQYQPGKILSVMIDKDDPLKIVIIK